ncbi:MAG: YncE family protein [Chitinophagaceae bacterium]|nr:YncE family protein [Chitinophagaceae bacterium]
MFAFLRIIPLFLFLFTLLIVAKQKRVLTTISTEKATDTTPHKKDYTKLIFKKSEIVDADAGTKSVLFNSNGTKLYAMNLEAMSIFEYNRNERKVNRIFKFKATKALGWDYDKKTTMESFEEKPVEACFTNNDKILWVSLHNAKGIVPIHIDTVMNYKTQSVPNKKLFITHIENKIKDSVYVPIIKTGKTPKVISCTNDNKFLLVSNWHSYNVSVLELNDTLYPYGKVITTIPLSSIPRGIAIDNENKKSYIAIMGGKSITVIDNNTWKIENNIKVKSAPRHIILDNQQRLFVSYNSLNKIACINEQTGKTLFEINTNYQPRTIALSKNSKYLFVTCYNGNTLDVFKINDSSFTKLYSLESKEKPVGIDVYEDENKLEAWVCNYVSGSLKVFTFQKE